MENRQRVFDLPHRTLRSLLGKFSELAGKTDFSNPNEIKRLKDLGSDLLPMLESHMHFEEAGILTEMERKVPGSIDQDRKEHQEVEPIQAELFERLENFDGSQSDTETYQFYLDFVNFQSIYLQHLHHEETVTEKLLWEHFTDEELRQITIQQFVEIPPPTMLLWLKYGIPAFPKAERIMMLQRVKAKAPEGAYEKALTALSTVITDTELEELKKEIK